MVTSRTMERFGKSVGIGANAVDFLRKVLDRVDQTGIAAKPEQGAVEMQIGVKHREHVAVVDRGAVLLLELVEFGELACGGGKRENPYRHDLQLLAHGGAAIGDALNDTLLLELEQRQAYVTAMGVEAVAQILLDQPLARMTPA